MLQKNAQANYKVERFFAIEENKYNTRYIFELMFENINVFFLMYYIKKYEEFIPWYDSSLL